MNIGNASWLLSQSAGCAGCTDVPVSMDRCQYSEGSNPGMVVNTTGLGGVSEFTGFAHLFAFPRDGLASGVIVPSTG